MAEPQLRNHESRVYSPAYFLTSQMAKGSTVQAVLYVLVRHCERPKRRVSVCTPPRDNGGKSFAVASPSVQPTGGCSPLRPEENTLPSWLPSTSRRNQGQVPGFYARAAACPRLFQNGLDDHGAKKTHCLALNTMAVRSLGFLVS